MVPCKTPPAALDESNHLSVTGGRPGIVPARKRASISTSGRTVATPPAFSPCSWAQRPMNKRRAEKGEDRGRERLALKAKHWPIKAGGLCLGASSDDIIPALLDSRACLGHEIISTCLCQSRRDPFRMRTTRTPPSRPNTDNNVASLPRKPFVNVSSFYRNTMEAIFSLWRPLAFLPPGTASPL